MTGQGFRPDMWRRANLPWCAPASFTHSVKLALKCLDFFLSTKSDKLTMEVLTSVENTRSKRNLSLQKNPVLVGIRKSQSHQGSDFFIFHHIGFLIVHMVITMGMESAVNQ